MTKQGIAYPSFSGGLNLLYSFFVNFLGFVLLFLFLKVCFVIFVLFINSDWFYILFGKVGEV